MKDNNKYPWSISGGRERGNVGVNVRLTEGIWRIAVTLSDARSIIPIVVSDTYYRSSVAAGDLAIDFRLLTNVQIDKENVPTGYSKEKTKGIRNNKNLGKHLKVKYHKRFDTELVGISEKGRRLGRMNRQ